jgi:hypothetical protein
MKYALRGSNGRYYVKGAGLSASSLSGATAVEQADLASVQTCLSNAGLGYTTAVPCTVSFAVTYIRKTALGSDGKVYQRTPNAAMGEIDPSKRRFATFDEAVQHGSRFPARRKERSDAPGTAGHIGFYVTETNDPVNAAINWKTGLTNPVS